MESVYENKRFRNLYTRRLNVSEFLKDYSEYLGTLLAKRNKKNAMKFFLDVSSEECEELSKSCDAKQLRCSTVPKSYVPKRRFMSSWALYDVSSIETSLATLAINQQEGREEKYKRTKSIRYPGQVFLEGETKFDAARQKTLNEKIDYLICVRIMCLIERKPKPMYQGSQEFLLPGNMTLDHLKDRIVCAEDYQAYNPSQSSIKPSLPVTRKKDVNKHGMFYIDDNFYIDGRNKSEGFDYSTVVREWAERKKIKVGSVKAMETSKLSDLNFRLGFPYLYQHQGKCEHLVIFTDARLMNQLDNPYLEDYPLMVTFAYRRGKACHLCSIRVAKVIVSDCDILPYDNAFLCYTCSLTYLYDEMGNETCQFKVFNYVDKTALL